MSKMFYPMIWAARARTVSHTFSFDWFPPHSLSYFTPYNSLICLQFFGIYKENFFSNKISTFYPETAIHQSSFLSIIPRCNHTKTHVEIWTSQNDIKCWPLQLQHHNTVKDKFETFFIVYLLKAEIPSKFQVVWAKMKYLEIWKLNILFPKTSRNWFLVARI